MKPHISNSNFIFRQIADDCLLIPSGEAALSVKGLVALSESGAFLYRKLQGGCERCDLIAAMQAEYEAPADVIEADVDAFLAQMRELGILVED